MPPRADDFGQCHRAAIEGHSWPFGPLAQAFMPGWYVTRETISSPVHRACHAGFSRCGVPPVISAAATAVMGSLVNEANCNRRDLLHHHPR